ncbi:hypothetical protein [Lysinibacillus xylanilyticus]|uniref:hypothetical protein n=1 Tax=Lysinibacillus xylanilyticus TaxID=582475 RepID=UPI003D085B3E
MNNNAIKQQTWREQVLQPQDGIATPVYFDDTRPNHVIITNHSQTDLYVSFDAGVSKNLYQYTIPAGATKVIAKPIPFYNLYVIRYGSLGFFNVYSYVDEFSASSISQTLETTATQEIHVGELAISELPPLPKGNNTIGSVDVNRLPPLPEGSNKIGVVELSSGAINVNNDNGLSNFKTGVMTVTGVATPVKIGASILANRKQLIMLPPTAGTIYWGHDSTVTAATGIPLSATDGSVSFDIKSDSRLAIYAVSDGTDRQIKVVEGA